MSKPKVYFACSIRGGGNTSAYLDIVTAIKKSGGDVLSEIFVTDVILYGGSPLPTEEIYLRDIHMIQEADLIIAEVSNPSLGVGYELAYAEKLKKPILCLFNASTDKKLSAMVLGNTYNLIQEYITPETLESPILDFIQNNS